MGNNRLRSNFDRDYSRDRGVVFKQLKIIKMAIIMTDVDCIVRMYMSNDLTYLLRCNLYTFDKFIKKHRPGMYVGCWVGRNGETEIGVPHGDGIDPCSPYSC